MRISFLFGIIAIPVLAACASRGGEARMVQGVKISEDKPGLWAQATIPADSALKIAMSRVPGGQSTKAELEEEDGRLVYSFDMKVAGKPGTTEVHVDAKTGEIVKVEEEKD